MSVTMYIYTEIDNPKHYSTADGTGKMSVTAILIYTDTDSSHLQKIDSPKHQMHLLW